MIYSDKNLGVVFFPSSEPRSFALEAEVGPGTSFEQLNRVMGYYEEIVNEFAGNSETIVSKVGYAKSRGKIPVNNGVIEYKFPEDWKEWKEPPSKTIAGIRKEVEGTDARYADVSWEISKDQDGPPSGKDINIEVRGDDFQMLKELADAIKAKISPLEGVVNLNDDLNLSQPEIKIVLNREKLALYDLSFREVADLLRTAVYGRKSSVLREGRGRIRHFREGRGGVQAGSFGSTSPQTRYGQRFGDHPGASRQFRNEAERQPNHPH